MFDDLGRRKFLTRIALLWLATAGIGLHSKRHKVTITLSFDDYERYLSARRSFMMTPVHKLNEAFRARHELISVRRSMGERSISWEYVFSSRESFLRWRAELDGYIDHEAAERSGVKVQYA